MSGGVPPLEVPSPLLGQEVASGQQTGCGGSERARVVLFAHMDSAAEAVRIIERHGRFVGLVAGGNRPGCLSPELAGLAARFGVPVLIQSAANHAGYPGFESRFRALRPDLIVSFSYSMLLRPGVLFAARLGGINLHNGILPRYRGANVVNWAVINGETHAGVSLHWMDQGMDTGPVIATASTPIAETDTALSVRDRLIPMGWELLDRHFPAVLSGNAPGEIQDENTARTWPRRTPEDGRIDWSWPAKRIHDLIRGLVSPWPGAWYEDANGRRIVLREWISFAEVERLKARLENRF